MSLTVFDGKGISAIRWERIESAVTAAGHCLARPFEAWIAADQWPNHSPVKVAVPVAGVHRRKRHLRYADAANFKMDLEVL